MKSNIIFLFLLILGTSSVLLGELSFLSQTTNDSIKTTETVFLDIAVSDLEIGKVYQVPNLNFKADVSNIEPASYEVLDQLYAFLIKNASVHIEIGGHTNTTPPSHYCDQLSDSRAKSIANYLFQKGIALERIVTKGYGKRKPLSYSNSSKERKSNQRVEIKILDI